MGGNGGHGISSSSGSASGDKGKVGLLKGSNMSGGSSSSVCVGGSYF